MFVDYFMTKWKKNTKEFEMNVINDHKGSRYVRIPKPLDKRLKNPKKIKFIIRGKEIILEKN